MLAGTMKDFLETANGRDQGEHGFYEHAIVPCAARAQFDIGRNTRSSSEADIGQNDAVSIKRLYQWQEDLIRYIGRIPGPRNDLAMAIDQHTELDAHDPTPIRLALLADLALAASLSNGMDQLDAIGVHDGEKGWMGQEACALGLMSSQQALQACTFRQMDEQPAIVSLQPTVKRAKVAPFEGKEDTDGHQFARSVAEKWRVGESASILLHSFLRWG